MGHPQVLLSVVVPVFNEREIFPQLAERLSLLKSERRIQDVEVLLVNDGSSDGTKELIDSAIDVYGFVGIHLSRNFGHQAAVSAGCHIAKGSFIAVIDGDLQDPPELLPVMMEEMYRQKADVIYGIRRSRKESPIKKVSYYFFYRILSAMSRIEIPLDSGDFGIVSRRVLDVMNCMPERKRFVRGIRAYSGFKQVPFPYHRNERAGGDPKYTIKKLFSLALDGLLSFSDIPLRTVTLFGVLTSGFSMLLGTYFLVWRLVSPNPLPGFATLIIGMLFLGGIQILSIGVLGEYIGRIHQEVKGRPVYIVESIVRKDSKGIGDAIETQ